MDSVRQAQMMKPLLLLALADLQAATDVAMTTHSLLSPQGEEALVLLSHALRATDSRCKTNQTPPVSAQVKTQEQLATMKKQGEHRAQSD
jgi:hypothetical protein